MASDTFGRYQLEERIGSGGLTEAWRAKRFGVEGFEKTLVVKILLPELARDAVFVDAFVREANLAVRLSHANVVQVFDLGRVEHEKNVSYYLAMEHVAGRHLTSVLDLWRRRGEPPPLGFTLYVAAEIAKALDHAHRRRDGELRALGIVHADLGAGNVLLSWEGEVKVSDFCLGRALYQSARRDFASDPHFADKVHSASPELLRGEIGHAASDLFSLGSLLYELLTGVHPFRGANVAETVRRVREARFRPLAELRSDLSPELVALVERALSLDPMARPESSARLYEELVALRYSSGARFGAADLAEMLEERHAEAGLLDSALELLEHTQTDFRLPVEPTPTAPLLTPAERHEPEPSVLGPLGELRSERELSALVLRTSGRALGREVDEHVRQLITRYGGKLLADGKNEVRAVFGHEPSDSLDTENAVRAALVVMRGLAPTLDVAAGVDVGRLRLDADGGVIEDERSKALFDAAQRLTRLAPRRVAVSPGAARNLRGLFELEPAMSGAKTPYFVGELKPFDAAFGRFVGRKTELRRFGELLSKAGHRELQVAGITGSHGVGKTRLVHEALDRIARGSFNVGSHVAQCLPRGREVPHSAVVALLSTLCGVREGDPPSAFAAVEPRLRALGLVEDEVDAVLGALGASRSPAQPGALSAGVARMLASLAEDRLHIVVWDDAHEIDDDSGALLASLAERLRSSRLLLLFVGRPRADAPYRAIPGFSDVTLGDMDDADVTRLVAVRLGVEQVPDELVAFVRQRAGGHPMFVEELLREAQDSRALSVKQGKIAELALDGALSVPRPLRTLLVDRVRRLAEPERDVLLAAAVLGTPVDLSVLAAMLDLPLGKVGSIAQLLAEKQLVTRPDPVTLGFSTTMLPEVVLGELSPDARVELHRAAANAYPMVLGPRTEQEGARIASHWAEAGDSVRAAGFYALSAAYHLSSRRLDRAASDFTRALELSDLHAHDAHELGEWIAGLGQAVRHVRSGTKIPELVQRLSLFFHGSTSIDGALRVRVTIDLGLILGALSRYKDAQRLLATVTGRAGEWPELERAALMAEAELASRQGEFKQALAALDRVKKTGAGEALDEHRRLVAAAQALGGAGEHERALAALAEARELVGDDDTVLALERSKVSGLVHGFRGDWARCADEAGRAAETARELGLAHEVAIHLHNQGDALMRIDELPRAYAALDASLSAAQRIGAERLVNLNQIMLAYLDALKGSEAARKTLGEKLAYAEAQKWTWDALTGRTLLGKLLGRRGDVAGARRELSLAKRLAEATSNKLVLDDCERALSELQQSRRP